MVEPAIQILCAQGDAADRLPLGEILRRAGYTVQEARTAEEVLRLAADRPELRSNSRLRFAP